MKQLLKLEYVIFIQKTRFLPVGDPEGGKGCALPPPIHLKCILKGVIKPEKKIKFEIP